MLKIKDLTVINNDKPILKNIDFEVSPGEIHVITGPKYSGKSALAHAITGHPDMEIENGSIVWKRKKLNKLSTSERAKLGIYISFQHPPEFDEITNWDLFKLCNPLKPSEIEDLLLKYTGYSDILELSITHSEKQINAGYMSDSEFKKNEILQMLMSDPKLIIIDEVEDGLDDEDSARVAAIIKNYVRINKIACVIVSRNHSFLDILEPTHVHIMSNGEIRVSGGPDLYKRIIEDEYSEFS